MFDDKEMVIRNEEKEIMVHQACGRNVSVYFNLWKYKEN